VFSRPGTGIVQLMTTQTVPRPRSDRRTVRVARWSATHPWRAVALWLVFVAACIAIGNVAGLHQQDSDHGVGQSGRAAAWIDDAELAGHDSENVLVTSRSGPLDGPQASAALRAVTARMHRLPADVLRVGTPATSPDGQARTVEVVLTDDGRTDPVLAATVAVQREFPALRVEQVGSVTLDDAVNKQVADDLSAAATFSLPVTLLIMLIAFGAIVAAGVPILLALSAVAAATGLSALVSHVIPDSGSTSAMILLMGMAVGVDYSLFYVKRARAERHAGRSTLDSIELAAATSGHSVLVSGAAVVVSMLGLFLAADVTFASLAMGSIVVVAVAVLGSLTVLPALLMLLGRRIDRPRVPVLWRWTMHDRQPRLWPALLRPSLRHPARTLVIAVLALGAVALPAFGLTLASDSARSLPTSIAEKQTLDRLDAAFPNHQASSDIVVKAPAAQAGAVRSALAVLRDRLADDPAYVGTGRLRSNGAGTVHVLTVDAPFDPESTQARAGVDELRADDVPRAIDAIPGAQWAVGGETARNIDADKHMADHLPWVIAFVVLLTMGIMAWVFRSVAIAIGTAVMNLLSAGAAFGVLVLVFQHHWAEGLLGFHSTGTVINWIPLFTFAVLFGLSMDYHVFVLGHIREAQRDGRSTADAVRTGITRSAGTVTSAAVVMVSVFAIFASLHMIEMKEMGLGLAVAVLVDALVVRIVILPAFLMLLGRRTARRRTIAAPAARDGLLVGQ
jgi:putative drug exporter of the RND superfamily